MVGISTGYRDRVLPVVQIRFFSSIIPIFANSFGSLEGVFLQKLPIENSLLTLEVGNMGNGKSLRPNKPQTYRAGSTFSSRNARQMATTGISCE